MARRIAWRTAVGIAAFIALLIVALLAAFGSGYVRNFRVPSEGMSPTLEKGDSFVALMNGGGGLRRGDIVLFSVHGSIYVQRIAAIGGDTIAFRDGIVVLNGKPVPQRLLGLERRPETADVPAARRLSEQLPGEGAPHEILDLGPGPFDEVAELRVPDGFVFVLGDNRDRSADSRVPRNDMGVELLSLADIRGRPLFCISGCDIGR